MTILKKIQERKNGEVYFTRLVIIDCRWFGLFLHIIKDDDPCLHDHPWSYVSLMLWGGYREYYDDGASRLIRPGTLSYHKAGFKHRLEMKRTAWTLFFTLPPVQDWGYYTPQGFVQGEKYERGRKSCK